MPRAKTLREDGRIDLIGLGKDEPTVLPRFDTRTGRLYRDVLGKTLPMQTINPANYEMLGKMAKLANGRFYRALDQEQLVVFLGQALEAEPRHQLLRSLAGHAVRISNKLISIPAVAPQI